MHTQTQISVQRIAEWTEKVSSCISDSKALIIELIHMRITLSVVRVVGVLVADAPNFEGAKGAKFRPIPPFCLFQNKVGCPPCTYKKFKRKNSSQFWDIWQNIFDPVCPVVKFQKNRKLRSGVVLLCWIVLHRFNQAEHMHSSSWCGIFEYCMPLPSECCFYHILLNSDPRYLHGCTGFRLWLRQIQNPAILRKSGQVWLRPNF